MLHTIRKLLVLSCALAAVIVHADTARQIMWKDLVPELPAESPFAKLTKEQLLALTDIAAVRDRKARGEKIPPIEAEDEQATTRKLEKTGVDVDGLLAKRKEITEQRRVRSQAANALLEGQVVRIPGYLLPLDFSGKEVTEFLLVPWVGACIHTPPPPPNQIVHVKPDKPYANASLYAPVWVTGRMSTTASKKSLYLVDGTSNIDIGYTMQATAVEPYKQ